ncbi:MAG: response regulator [Spirosomataceae bacterium]
MKKNILIIEDESDVVNFIKKGLTEYGFEVAVAFDGSSGFKMACEKDYSLIILDIMLPQKNGIEVCNDLRNNGVNSPILFLSALNTPENIANGLNLGADDYLVKPFKFSVLIARINAILRRSSLNSNSAQADNNIFTISNLIVNDNMKSVTR